MKKTLLAGAVACALAALPAEAEEKTVDAIASWIGVGEIYKVAPDQGFFTGKLAGTLFVAEEESGALHAAVIECPGTVEIALEDAAQKGAGYCIITARDGDTVYATWTCAGTHLVGCAGEFVLTGGTGRFEGITGQGPVTIRSALRTIAVDALTASVTEEALGVMVLNKLTYKLP